MNRRSFLKALGLSPLLGLVKPAWPDKVDSRLCNTVSTAKLPTIDLAEVCRLQEKLAAIRKMEREELVKVCEWMNPDFPPNPKLGDTFVQNGRTYRFMKFA